MISDGHLERDEPQAREECPAVPGKRVLLSGVIVGTDGRSPIHCTVRNISVKGAKISLPAQLKIGDHVYLVDSHNQAAHLGNVFWASPRQAGLSFIRSYSLRKKIPAELKFLKEQLLQSKLTNILALVKRGLSIEAAANTVGLSAEIYSSLCDEIGLDGKAMTQLRNQLNQLFL